MNKKSYKLNALEELHLDSKMFEVADDRRYQTELLASGIMQESSGYIAIVILDKERKELRRIIRWLNGLTNTPKHYKITFNPGLEGKYAVVICRVNTENAKPSDCEIDIQSLDDISLKEVEKNSKESYDELWDIKMGPSKLIDLSDDELRLKEKIESYGKWMYKFDFSNNVSTPIISNEFLKVHETRRKMIFSKLDQIFDGRWESLNCLDIACNEGFYAFELGKRHAKKVLGFDARPINVEKANLVRDWFDYKNVEFFVDDVNNIDVNKLGKFELVLLLGLLYHIENPMLILRIARSLTKQVCVIDTQVARSGVKISMGLGTTGFEKETQDYIGIIEEPTYKDNITASVTGLSFVPNKSALLTMLRYAGFSDIEIIEPFPDSYEQYTSYDRIIIIAK